MSGYIYRFEGYRLDPARRELCHGDPRVPLRLKAFECLAYLIEHRDRVVGRDELISAVWGKVEINGSPLRQTILHARRALRQVEPTQGAIQTVPNFGYRWGLDTEVEDSEASPQGQRKGQEEAEAIASSSTDASATPSSNARPIAQAPTPRIYPIGRKWLALSAILLLMIGIWSRFDTGPERAETSNQAKSYRCADDGHLQDIAAVLPVKAHLDDEQLSWARLGLMESIAARLRKGGRHVVPSVEAVHSELITAARDASDRNVSMV